MNDSLERVNRAVDVQCKKGVVKKRSAREKESDARGLHVFVWTASGDEGMDFSIPKTVEK
jgi:hypothetical protein